MAKKEFEKFEELQWSNGVMEHWSKGVLEYWSEPGIGLSLSPFTNHLSLKEQWHLKFYWRHSMS
jgi:hypothetical protein